MTRKDYVAIAEQFSAQYEEIGRQYLSGNITESETYSRQDGVNDMMERIANIFAKDNPRFDRERFCAACEK